MEPTDWMPQPSPDMPGDDGWTIPPIDEAQARWALGLLRLMIDVVGAESLLGVTLMQTVVEIEDVTGEDQASPRVA